MNILYLHSHDTGRIIQPYGVPVNTPALQALAEGGTLFRDAHAAAPTCSPSRAGLLTGQCAHAAGMVALAHRGGELRHPERHLAYFLRQHGFTTLRCGVSHVGGPADEFAYSERINVDVRQGEQARAAVDFLRNRGKDGPFFLDVGFLETHRTEWIVHGFSLEHHSPRDGDGDPSYVQVPAPLPDHPDTRRDWLDLRHAVERLDGCYGEILRALHEAGLADDTLVIATTDHGPALPDMKCKLTHHGTGVLQILRFPGGRGRGRVVDALVSHLDFYPTVCELLGVPAPEWAEGKSLLPLVAETPAEAIREVIFSEVTFHAAFEPKRCVRDKKWNYIRNFAAPHPEVLPNCDDGHSKRFWMKRGLRERQVPEEELYDLTFDPQERCNRADDPDCAEIKSAMREKLRRWMEETDDLLLQSDPAVLPERLTVNPWDNDHPGKEGSVEWDRSEWSKIRPL